MASLAIPPVGRPWIPYLSRPLYISFHGFDWSRINAAPRPQKSRNGHLRVFGLGFDYTWNQSVRYYMVSAGCHWLVNVAVMRQFERPQDMRFPSFTQPPPAKRAWELTLLGAMLSCGCDDGESWGWRLFFRHRRLHKAEAFVRSLLRGTNADR
jgi:hypothetical protein